MLLLVQISGHLPNVVTTLINVDSQVIAQESYGRNENTDGHIISSSNAKKRFLPIDFAFAMVDVEAFILGFSNTV